MGVEWIDPVRTAAHASPHILRLPPWNGNFEADAVL
jgi:hypothetical protein